MNYGSYLGAAMDGPSSRHTSRAPSPQPRGVGPLMNPPPPTPLPPHATGGSGFGGIPSGIPSVRHTAPSAASFGPQYYQSGPTSDPPTHFSSTSASFFPTTSGGNAGAGQLHLNPHMTAFGAAISSGGLHIGNASAPLSAPPLPMQAPFAPRGANQPPRNSMEMVQDALEQWKGKLETEQQALAALEEEERRLDAEDSMLRRTLAEMHVRHRSIDHMMLATQRGWSVLLEQEREFFAREADPHQNEDRVLAERVAQLEQGVHHRRLQFQDVDRRSELVRAELTRHLPTEAKLKQMDEEMSELLAEMRKLEERRSAAKRKCDQYYELESARERAARKHHATLVKEAIDEGELMETASVAASSSRSGSTAPAVMQRRGEPDDSPDSALAMDSVVLSVCNNTKKRRVDLGGSTTAAPVAAF